MKKREFSIQAGIILLVTFLILGFPFITLSQEIVADSEFRPETNGFGFENYGSDTPVTNLTAIEMAYLFGDKVCASGSLEQNTCILTPPANQWMVTQNKGMSGGHCEGMAVLSRIFYANTDVADPENFGSAKVVDLKLTGNAPLQRQIAQWFVTQALDEVSSKIIKVKPSEIVQKLADSYTTENSEQYVIGFYKRDGTGGHAVLPYAIEDAGNGIKNILIYDNNYPKEAKRIAVDTTKETWKYLASINPSVPAEEYEGDATTLSLEIVPMSARFTKPFKAPFLAEAKRSAGPVYNEIKMFSEADLYITHTQTGKKFGYVKGTLVQEIPDVKMRQNKYSSVAKFNEPTYYVPINMEFSLTVDGSQLTKECSASISMIGPGYFLEIEDILIEPGQTDEIFISGNGMHITYTSDAAESPDISLGVETPAADYEFVIKAAESQNQIEFDITLDTKNGELVFNTTENAGDTTYEIAMSRIDNTGEQYFYNNDILLKSTDTAYFKYLEWTGNTSKIALGIDSNNDGTVDKTIQLDDEDMQGSFDSVDISGKVTKEDGTTPLASAVIEANGVTGKSDDKGEFRLLVQPDANDRISFSVSSPGYFPIKKSIDAEDGENQKIAMTYMKGLAAAIYYLQQCVGLTP